MIRSLRSLSVVIAFLLGAACVPMSSSAQSRYDFSALAERLVNECESGAYSGVVAVAVEGDRAFTHVCGPADIESGAPVQWDSLYRIFSTSKLLTALTVMRIADRGEMDLDAPIARYVPESPDTWAGVTIRHLLNHTSGLPDRTNDLLGTWRGNDSEAIVRVIRERDAADLTPTSNPGEVWSYNNFGYELLAEAAERVAGLPFARVIDREVFAPAGMVTARLEQGVHHDGAGLSSVADPRLVNGYNGTAEAPERAAPLSFIQRGAGAIHASAEDMLALGDALLNRRVVSNETWAMMTAPQSGSDDQAAHSAWSGYGLGVVVRSEPLRALGHSGGTNGYLTMFNVYPEQDAVVVVMTNRSFADARGLLREIEGELALGP